MLQGSGTCGNTSGCWWDHAIKFANDLQKAREQQVSTQRSLEDTNRRLKAEKELHSKAKSDLGIVATLAETLKGEKQSLERSLDKERTARSKFESQALNFAKQLAELRVHHDRTQQALESELAERLGDLHASNQSLEKLQVELQDAESALKETAYESDSLKQHLSFLESGRHELLEKQSELQESLEEAQESGARASEELCSQSILLEQALSERDDLLQQNESYLKSHEREAELEAKLVAQQKAFEDRLRHIHSILGLKFTTALQKEVRTFQKHAIRQMPRSFKVPLLLHHQQQHQQPVQSS